MMVTGGLARRLSFAGVLAGAVAAVPVGAVLADGSEQPAPRVVADGCVGTVIAGGYIPPCVGDVSGGSFSAGAPSQGLLTLKNWCNTHIGGCSSYFFYPPGPIQRPDPPTVRHSP